MPVKDEPVLPGEPEVTGRNEANGSKLAPPSAEEQRSGERRSRDRSDRSKQQQDQDRELKEVSREIQQTLMKKLVSEIDTKDVLQAVAKLVQKKKKKLDAKTGKEVEDKAGEVRTPTGSRMKSARKGSFDSPK